MSSNSQQQVGLLLLQSSQWSPLVIVEQLSQLQSAVDLL